MNDSKGNSTDTDTFLQFLVLGKPLKMPLEFGDSVGLNATDDFDGKITLPEVKYDLINEDSNKEKEQKTRVRTELKLNTRLPHNAGTASIIARRLRECPREESPPPVLEAEVIVY